MNTKNDLRKAKEVLSMSIETKERLANVSKLLQGKELFPEKIERAKRLFNTLKALPL